MRYVSVCSGIEAASVAWEPLGWEPLAFSEIDAFPSAVLAHRFPEVPNLGDFTTIERDDLPCLPDILVGGTPCQAFSVAGLRESLDDDRGNLTLEFIRLADRLDDGQLTILWENVPGVLSTKDNAFGAFLAGIVGADSPLLPPDGKRWGHAGMVDGPKRRAAWRILDAQWFGVAQRRKRVFVVASASDRVDPAEVLLEPESLPRHTPPSREPRERVATTAEAYAGSGSEPNCLTPWDVQSRRIYDETGQWPSAVEPVLYEGSQHHGKRESDVAGPLTCGQNSTVRGDTPLVTEPTVMVPALSKRQGQQIANRSDGYAVTTGAPPIIHELYENHRADARYSGPLQVEPTMAARYGTGGDNVPLVLKVQAFASSSIANYTESDVAGVVRAQGGDLGGGSETLAVTSAVRRLTPIECERLQGFPDDWTNIPRKVVRDDGVGPCAKQVVTATVVAKNGTHYVATNHCDTPQAECPRSPSDGYELCSSVCNQKAHAEVNAVRLAGKYADGAVMYLNGHYHACEPCIEAARDAGVNEIVIGEAPGTAADSHRYKACGNSMAVPVIYWLGERIQRFTRQLR